MEQKKPEKRQYGVKVNRKFILVMCAVFFVLLIGVGVLTRVLPLGAYEREEIDGQSYIVNGSYKIMEGQERLPVWRWFTAPVEVLFSGEGGLVILVTGLSVAIGGVYYVLDKADLLKRFMGFLYRKFSKHKYMMLLVITLVFLLIGSLLGITDEIIGIVPLMILLSISFGWDSLVGACMCLFSREPWLCRLHPQPLRHGACPGHRRGTPLFGAVAALHISGADRSRPCGLHRFIRKAHREKAGAVPDL